MSEKNKLQHSVIVIGSGPAGYTSAIYLSRAGISPIVIEGPNPGGQLTLATVVENFPGFPDGVEGHQLMEYMRKQSERLGAKIISGSVTSVDFFSYPFKVYADETEYDASAVIIATGCSARSLGLESEKELLGRGVSTCATCDGFFFRGKEVVVVGGGDAALEEAIYLARFCNKVTVIHRRDKFRASWILVQRAYKEQKISFITNSVVIEILGREVKKVKGVKIKNLKNEMETKLECEGVFVAIGHKPNTSIFKNQLTLDEDGYIKTFEGTQTIIVGVFACGDVVDRTYRQAITAAASGCKAALDCQRYLENL